MTDENTSPEHSHTEKIVHPSQHTSEPTSPRLSEKRKENDNVIFVGSKPLVSYVRGVITQFTKWGAQEVTIKSRGKFISKAADVAEIARRSLKEKNVVIRDISISSESFESNGKKTNISTMDIVLR